MNCKIRKFLEDDKECKELYNKVVIENDKEAYQKLKNRYVKYLLNVHFLSYLDKTLTFTARRFFIKIQK